LAVSDGVLYSHVRDLAVRLCCLRDHHHSVVHVAHARVHVEAALGAASSVLGTG
jgi:hypothetical protein